MSSIKQIIPFVKPYKKYAFLNIFFNVLYALFSTLSFIALMPMLDVLFKQDKKNYIKPVYTGILHLQDFLENYLSFHLTKFTMEHGISFTLGLLVSVIISTFLLKNLFDYLAMFFITFLRNGIVKDMRNALYKKTLELPIAFFSEKRKGDTIARISNDVNEVQNSMLSILEIIVS